MASPANVLLVDDDTQSAQTICALIQMHVARVFSCAMLEEALNLAHQHRPSLVLLDLLLPDSPAVQTLLAIPVFRGLGARVVVITGAVLNPGIEIAAEKNGAEATLGKSDPAFSQRLLGLLGL